MALALPNKRRGRMVFSLRSLLLVVTACAVIAAVVHWLFIRERPYLYITSNKPQATYYLDGLSLGKPPISLMRNDIERLYAGNGKISSGPIRLAEKDFGAFVTSIQKANGASPLLWMDAGPAPGPRITMPYGKASLVMIGHYQRPQTGITMWSNYQSAPRGACLVDDRVATGRPIAVRVRFPDNPMLPTSRELRGINQDVTAWFNVWRTDAPLKTVRHKVPVKAEQWNRNGDAYELLLEMPPHEPGEYLVQPEIVIRTSGVWHFTEDVLPDTFAVESVGANDS